MAHIAIDARIINSSTGRYVERLIHYLEKIDHENNYSILVRKKDKDFWQPSRDNFSVKIADFADYSFAEQIGLKSLLDELKPDLVHFCMPQQPILYSGVKVTTVHDLTLLKTYNSDKNWFVFRAKQLVGHFVFKRIAKTNRHIITPSNFTKKEYQKLTGIPDRKITISHEAADVTVGSLREYPLPYNKYIMYVGQQSDYKNIKRLGDAHQLLLEKYPDLGLLLVGRKNAATLKNEAYFNSKHYKNILFTDFIDDDQRDWLYTHAQGYVFPSLMEGFGLPGLEAMGYKTPVISSNATCLPEIYGDAAHYFDPYNTKGIARAIDEVLADASLRANLIERGTAQLANYSWEKMARETLEVYREAMSSSGQ